METVQEFHSGNPNLVVLSDADTYTKNFQSQVKAVCMDSNKEWLLALLGTARSEEQIAKAFKVHQHQQPPVFTVKISLDWDILGFIHYQDYSTEDMQSPISRSITLSGDGNYVQALPCLEYMQQIWPRTGSALSKLMDELVRNPDRVHNGKSSNNDTFSRYL